MEVEVLFILFGLAIVLMPSRALLALDNYTAWPRFLGTTGTIVYIRLLGALFVAVGLYLLIWGRAGDVVPHSG